MYLALEPIAPELLQADRAVVAALGTNPHSGAHYSAPDSGPLPRGCTVAVCTRNRPDSLVRFLDSLGVQDARPARLVIVDSSPGRESEAVVMGRPTNETLADEVLYFRVGQDLAGLTRQRNFALRWVATDLVAFFDDDVVLQKSCLMELERAMREGGNDVVGVGGYVVNGVQYPPLLWRVRRALGIVRDLTPGTYQHSGMSIPWSFLSPTEANVYGDYLSGCAMMWKAHVAIAERFCESFSGYAQGEDLEFSLRAGRSGRLLVAGKARLEHFAAPGGRPAGYKLGYDALFNRYEIHRRGLANRLWKDRAWFVYAWSMDTLLLVRHFLFPRRAGQTFLQILGRVRGAWDIARGRHSQQ